MAQEPSTQSNRHCFVRLPIGVSAQFHVDTHREVSFRNLRRYFSSVRFPSNKNVPAIIKFLDNAEDMGCTLLGYSNPLSSTSIPYAEFEVEVPEEVAEEFDEKYARYFYFI